LIFGHCYSVKPYSVFVYTRSIDLTIQGDGSSIRSFIHVEDVCLALNLIINKQDKYIIGCWDEMTVLEVATLICTYYKRGQYFDKLTKLKFIPDRPFNDKRYFISNEKLQSLGWTPKITLVRKFTLRTSHIKI
jgi:dTDP-D-glucose 4,6-dehydratase